jgi:hypothetical protein
MDGWVSNIGKYAEAGGGDNSFFGALLCRSMKLGTQLLWPIIRIFR